MMEAILEDVARQSSESVPEIGNKRKAKLNQNTARVYLETHLLGDLKDSIKDLLGHIQTTGFLNQYWIDIDKLNKKAVRKSIRAERARQQLAAGSDYESAHDDELEATENEFEDWSNESSGHEESSGSYASEELSNNLKAGEQILEEGAAADQPEDGMGSGIIGNNILPADQRSA